LNRPIRTLLFSTLYPSSVRPQHGIFVETRLRELLKLGGIECTVMAPVPWFPSSHARWGHYANFAQTPEHEQRQGITVLHPRYLLIPKIGMTFAPLLLALSCAPALRRLMREGGRFDLIDAHYFYPDGVAAALLAYWFRLPLVITARGSDLTLIPHHALPRRMIRWAARRADAAIGVCSALVDVLRGWGLDSGRLHVMRNGVDFERFHPLSQDDCRKALGLTGTPLVLSVGRLVELKGHHLVIEALALLRQHYPEACLHIIGEGPERERLLDLAKNLGLEESVRLQGNLDQDDLAQWYGAADLLALASSSEGWANVLLESMACGTPVVATRNWGTPEVVSDAGVGLLVDERSAPALAEAFERLLASPPAHARVAEYARGFSWTQTSQAQFDLFSRLASRAQEKP
jgi:glycosyltransferase involved in cell wall biosynthesis